MDAVLAELHPEVSLLNGNICAGPRVFGDRPSDYLLAFCLYGLQYVHIEMDIVKLGRSIGRGTVIPSTGTRIDQLQPLTGSDGGSCGGEWTGRRIQGCDPNVSICFKPAKPEMVGMAQQYEQVVDRIIPCIWITPIDCFWEESKPLGPTPATDKGRDLGMMISMLKPIQDIQGRDVSWKNLNSTSLIHEINEMLALGSYTLMFDRAGIGRGYLDRPCMDPLDPECPKESPNYYETCNSGLIYKRLAYMKKRNETVEPDNIEEWSPFDFWGRKKREAEPVAEMAAVDEAMEKKEGKKVEESPFPKYPDYAKEMNGGCVGFARGVLNWPEDMILGAAQ